MGIKYRKDYVAPHYRLATTDLEFTLDPTQTIVRAKLAFADYVTRKALVLNGQYMTLQEIKIDGKSLAPADYELTDTTLTLHPQAKTFILETTVGINPSANTRLAGLYASDGMLCTL